MRAKGHTDNNYSGTDDIAMATPSNVAYTVTLFSGSDLADSVLFYIY